MFLLIKRYVHSSTINMNIQQSVMVLTLDINSVKPKTVVMPCLI